MSQSFCTGRVWPLALALPLLVSCGSDSGTTVGDVIENPVAEVTVAPDSTDVDIGSTTTLSATALTQSGDNVSGSANIAWGSDDASIASVQGSGASAVVTGVGEGVTTIRATAESVTGEARVLVNDPTTPRTPSAITAEPVSDTEMDISWGDESANEDEFRIEREQVASAASTDEDDGPAAVFSTVGTVGPNQTSFRDSGLSPDASYRYLVRACNENGCVPAEGSAAEQNATTDPVTPHPTLVFEPSDPPRGSVGVA